jgi:hypothetical protein
LEDSKFYTMSLSANSWKGLSIACFSVVSLIGAWVAILLDDRDNELIVSCGVMFSAGVLLAGGFVHLLNDSNETFLNLGYDDFQWAFLIAGKFCISLCTKVSYRVVFI